VKSTATELDCGDVTYTVEIIGTCAVCC